MTPCGALRAPRGRTTTRLGRKTACFGEIWNFCDLATMLPTGTRATKTESNNRKPADRHRKKITGEKQEVLGNGRAAGCRDTIVEGASCGLEEQEDAGLLQVKEQHAAETLAGAAAEVGAHSDAAVACETDVGECTHQCSASGTCKEVCPSAFGVGAKCQGGSWVGAGSLAPGSV